MAKRKKRKQRNRKLPAVDLDPAVIRQRAEAEIAAGRPRRAREGFRRLYKKDPDQYRDRYVEVTTLVVTECLDQDKLTEAAQLLDHLEEIGIDPSGLRPLRMRLATGRKDFKAMAEFSADMLASEDPAQRIAAADTLVLGRAEPAAEIRAAISHLCRSEWDEMRSALKGIARKSPFAHWRLFLRGCAAYYTGDPGEADRCFARLPPNSLPDRKAAAFEVLRGNWRDADDGTVAGACLLAGDPKLAKVLPEAQQRWTQGKYLAAYRGLSRSVREFPSLEPDIWGQLSRFFQLADRDLPGTERNRWLQDALEGNFLRSLKLDPASYILSNILTRALHGSAEFDLIASAWEQFLKIREKFRGKNARFTARCHLARALAMDPGPMEMHSPFGFFMSRPARRHERHERYDPMIRSLEASARADPTFEAPTLKLLDLYRTQDRMPEANRLLDDMTKRFPESKAVLLEAGRACLDRKVHAKGLKYLEEARALDPLDAEILTQIRRGLREKAVAHFHKGTTAQVQKGRQTLEQLLASIPRNAPIGESRGYVLILWSVLEEGAPRDGTSLAKEKFEAAGREVPPHVAEFYRVLQRGLVAPPRPEKGAHHGPPAENQGPPGTGPGPRYLPVVGTAERGRTGGHGI